MPDAGPPHDPDPTTLPFRRPAEYRSPLEEWIGRCLDLRRQLRQAEAERDEARRERDAAEGELRLLRLRRG